MQPVDGRVRLGQTKAPSATEPSELAYALAQRIGRNPEPHGLLKWGVEHSCLAGDELVADRWHSSRASQSAIVWRVAQRVQVFRRTRSQRLR